MGINRYKHRKLWNNNNPPQNNNKHMYNIFLKRHTRAYTPLLSHPHPSSVHNSRELKYVSPRVYIHTHTHGRTHVRTHPHASSLIQSPSPSPPHPPSHTRVRAMKVRASKVMRGANKTFWTGVFSEKTWTTRQRKSGGHCEVGYSRLREQNRRN